MKELIKTFAKYVLEKFAKTDPSKAGEMSMKDWKKILLLVGSFLAGFYFTNTTQINALVGQYVSPEWVGIVTAFIYYFFKLLTKDNTQGEIEKN